MQPRLKSSFWVDALVRRAAMSGASAFITHKGDAERGDVLIKIARLNGEAAVLAPSPMMSDTRSFDWLPEAGVWSPESEVDELIRRRQGYDPDLWVVEIEDRDGRHFLTEPVNGEPDSREHGPKA